MTTLSLIKLIDRSSWRPACLAILLALAYFAFSQSAEALLPAPTPDGSYLNWNTAEGLGSLFSLTSGGFNTAIGGHALYGNSTGGSNTAVGAFALAVNSFGYWNVAVGQGALRNNSASANVAVGYLALYNNTDGSVNTATGYQALFKNNHGLYNTAFGESTLHENINGNDNTAIGREAGAGNSSGSGNIYIGSRTTANFEGEGGTIRIGNAFYSGYNACYIQGIYGKSVDPSTQQTAMIDEFGKLGSLISSRRFKRDIKPMDKASAAILALKPVTFYYKDDAKNTPCFGLIAEDVAQVDPDLVTHDKSGEILSVRYEQINAMLLNEFLKEHRKVRGMEVSMAQQKKEFEATIAQQEKEIRSLTASLKEQAAQIQKVSAQVGLSKPTPHVVTNQ